MLTRALPLILIAAVAFGLGVYESGAAGRAERGLVKQYVSDWANSDFPAMYGLLDQASRRRITEAAFRAEYADAAATATLLSLVPGRLEQRRGNYIAVNFLVHTRVFGTLHEPLQVPLQGSGGSARIDFRSLLLFPGLRAGEQLTRRSVLGSRGALLADDGTPLAQGPGRSSPIPTVAGEIVGALGPIPPDETARYALAGYPADAQVGLDGLERIFQRRLAGRIGGRLLAGHRLLAQAPAGAGQTVHTTIDPTVEQAAIDAVSGSYAGITVIDPRSGAVLGLAGIAFSAVQPPGSTMKIITAAAAFQAGLATINTTYPYETEATIEGYQLKNSQNESCGGTLIQAFAVSCNSVFAPLGVQVGAQRLVSMAERFGFNHRSQVPGALESTIPSAATIGGPLAVGSSAIGQGMVQASTLQMAIVGATIADRGRRPLPTLLYGARPRFVPATSARVAAEVQQMMVAVVRSGTGTAAAIPGVEVAGKTGTAELANTGTQKNAKQSTDAWFVGYAPVGAPAVVACALFPASGFGATVAAPAVKPVLEAALAAHL
jgi:cell division protein FtsI/penicillin-binding protein 2